MYYKHTVEDVDLGWHNLPFWKRWLGALLFVPRWQESWAVYEFEIEFSCSPFVPAQVSGPPENCYPAEGGEIEDWSVSLTDASHYDEEDNEVRSLAQLTDEEKRAIESKVDAEIGEMGSLYDRLAEHASEHTDYEPDYDAVEEYERAEAMREMW